MNRRVPLFLLCLLFSSCATIREVRVEPSRGGVIAIQPRDSEDARAKATARMALNCRPKGYVIVKEEEVQTGSVSETASSQSGYGQIRGSGNESFSATHYNQSQGSATTHTYQTTEWQITYQCK